MVVPAAQAVPNALLRQAREALNETQDEVADGLVQFGAGGVTGGLVSKWERGICRPSRFYQRLLCRLFEATADELGFGGHRVSTKASAAESGSLAPDVTHDEMEALELLQRVEASDVGPATLEGLTLAVDDLCRRYPITPPEVLLGWVRQYRHHVSRLLEARATLTQRRHLMVIGGWLSLLAACVHVDLGQRRAAVASRGTARQLGRHAEHSELEAWAFEVQAWQGLLDGQYREAVELCQAGQRVTEGWTSAAVQLTAQEARAWARLGEAKQTHAALDRAAAMVGYLPPPAQPDHHFTFDPRKLTSYAATTLAWLGDSEEAEAYAREVIRYYQQEAVPEQAPRRLATAHLDLGLVVTQEERPEEASHLGNLALDSGRLVPSNIWRAEELDRLLTDRYGELPEVRDYHDHYVEVERTVARGGRSA
jgi:transcriptional regulator with XRE-family HTH domain